MNNIIKILVAIILAANFVLSFSGCTKSAAESSGNQTAENNSHSENDTPGTAYKTEKLMEELTRGYIRVDHQSDRSLYDLDAFGIMYPIDTGKLLSPAISAKTNELIENRREIADYLEGKYGIGSLGGPEADADLDKFIQAELAIFTQPDSFEIHREDMITDYFSETTIQKVNDLPTETSFRLIGTNVPRNMFGKWYASIDYIQWKSGDTVNCQMLFSKTPNSICAAKVVVINGEHTLILINDYIGKMNTLLVYFYVLRDGKWVPTNLADKIEPYDILKIQDNYIQIPYQMVTPSQDIDSAFEIAYDNQIWLSKTGYDIIYFSPHKLDKRCILKLIDGKYEVDLAE